MLTAGTEQHGKRVYLKDNINPPQRADINNMCLSELTYTTCVNLPEEKTCAYPI